MAMAPAELIAAPIGRDREQPRWNHRVGGKPAAFSVKSHKNARDDVLRIRRILEVTVGEVQQRLLPAEHQPLQSRLLAGLQGAQIRLILLGVRRHH
jgi:hypothetical protein